MRQLPAMFIRLFRSRRDLLLEVAALRHQLGVYQRQRPQPRLRPMDRMFWIWLSRAWPRWKSGLVIVQPDTVLRWHREGFRRHWRRISVGTTGRPRIPHRHIHFIQQMSRENPDWGEDTIALEMKLKLGVEHAPSTVGRYLVRGRPPRSTWRSFLASHAAEVFALDFTTHYLWDYKICYVLVIRVLDTRRIVHTGVTSSPTLAWVQQQIRQATPWDESPRFLLHDNDGIFGQRGADTRRRKRPLHAGRVAARGHAHSGTANPVWRSKRITAHRALHGDIASWMLGPLHLCVRTTPGAGRGHVCELLQRITHASGYEQYSSLVARGASPALSDDSRSSRLDSQGVWRTPRLSTGCVDL